MREQSKGVLVITRMIPAFVASLLGLATATSSASAQGVYDGRQVTMVVGTEAGAGYDIYGRIVARHIGRFIPGKPNVIVQNMPGAGSAKAAEYLYALAPKDGSTFGIVFPGILVEPLTAEANKFRFQPVRFAYVGSADSGTRMCVTYKTSKIKTFEDAQKLPSNFGGSTPGTSTTDYSQMLIKLAGAKIKIINGYRSSIDTVIAMERGEIDGMCGLDISSLRSMRTDWVGTPEAQLILQAALVPNAELLKMGAPSIWDYITGDNRKAAEIVIAQQEFHRPFVAPPETPPAQLAVLRTAFAAATKDAEFLADAARINLSIAPKDGEAVASLVKQLYASPPELVERLRQALRP